MPQSAAIVGVSIVDPEVGALFMELRRALGVPSDTLARLLGTTAATLAALEAGQLSRLPAWAETERVVRGYTGLAGIDPTPMLSRIRTRLDQPGVGAAARNTTGRALAPLGPQSDNTVPRPRSASQKPAPKPARRIAVTLPRVKLPRRMAAISTAIGIAGAIFMAVGPLYSAMPGPMQRAIMAAIDKIAWGGTTLPDGMRLIDPANPRARRGDKLQTAGR